MVILQGKIVILLKIGFIAIEVKMTNNNSC